MKLIPSRKKKKEPKQTDPASFLERLAEESPELSSEEPLSVKTEVSASLPTNESEAAVRRRRRQEKRLAKKEARKSAYVRVKHHYVRNFYFAFAGFFIVFGLIGIFWFLYQQDPDIFGHAEAYYQTGLEQRQEGNLQKAETSFLRCLEITPTHTDARLNLTDLYMEQGRYSGAQTLLEEGISLQPRNEEYYRQMILLLTRQNRITEAMDYFSSISAVYIQVKLQDGRPSMISSAPDPGTYSEPVNVTLSVPEGTTVYYTTDGSDPNLNSTQYNEGDTIYVERGGVQIRAFAITEDGMIGDLFSVSYRVYNDNTSYVFADPKVERLVRMALGKTTGTIYYRDLELVTSLSTASAMAATLEGKITTLKDLNELPNLTELILDGEDAIDSLEPLKNLLQLRKLSLNGCGLNNEKAGSLSSLVWLNSLSLKNNSLSDLSFLTALTGLRTLDLANNQLMSLSSLSGLGSLQSLNLSGNALNSVAGIGNLANLTVLDMSDNMLTDVAALASCPLLTDLNLSSNLLTNIDSLAAIVRLQTLNLSGNDISSLVPLSGCSSLMNLNVSGTLVSDLSALVPMASLTTLDVSRTAVNDFTPLRGKSVRHLCAAGCFLVDVSTLTTLTSIETLDISDNYITDIGGLAMLYRLNILDLSRNLSTDLSPLLNCSALDMVNCTGMAVSDENVAKLQDNGVSVIR